MVSHKTGLLSFCQLVANWKLDVARTQEFAVWQKFIDVSFKKNKNKFTDELIHLNMVCTSHDAENWCHLTNYLGVPDLGLDQWFRKLLWVWHKRLQPLRYGGATHRGKFAFKPSCPCDVASSLAVSWLFTLELDGFAPPGPRRFARNCPWFAYSVAVKLIDWLSPSGVSVRCRQIVRDDATELLCEEWK